MAALFIQWSSIIWNEDFILFPVMYDDSETVLYWRAKELLRQWLRSNVHCYFPCEYFYYLLSCIALPLIIIIIITFPFIVLKWSVSVIKSPAIFIRGLRLGFMISCPFFLHRESREQYSHSRDFQEYIKIWKKKSKN